MLCPQGSYTKAIDIWSVGCIFAELIGGKALFPGKNYIHQLNLILDVLGTDCTKSVMEKIDNERARNFILSRPAKAKVEWKTMFPHATEQALDLLDNMLTFDADHRYTVEQCLAHPYLATYHDAANPEPTADSLWNEQEFENMELGIEELKKLLWDELQHFKSQ
jgi:serine/threonine protein kinase